MFSLLRAIRIFNPKKSSVVMFSNANSTIMQKMILENIDHTILHDNKEVFYLTPQILIHMIKNLIVTFLSGRRPRRLYLHYLLGCLEYIRPKIVITSIDNSSLFHFLSRFYKSAEFYAIQNGVRSRYDMTKLLPKPPAAGSIIYMQNLICFGHFEKDLYTRYGHKIKRFHPVGSLIGGYYKTQVIADKVKNEFDICLVSQWRKSIMEGERDPEVKKGLIILDKHLSKYVKDRNLSICVATCSNDPQEREYFKSAYGDRIQIIDFDRMNMSTYAAMDHSYVVIALDSTAAREAFGWGKKVLFCNFTGEDNYDFPKPGFWSINKENYEEFKRKLDYLIKIEDKEYQNISREYAKYVMNYDFSMPAHIYIRNIISNCVNN